MLTAERWFETATHAWPEWDPAELAVAKASTRISVVIPARNEQDTIGEIVTGIRAELVDKHQLVDELVVIDSDSTDATAQLAREAGAAVHPARDIRPDLGTFRGKGEALWKSQFVTDGDVLVFIDADLTEWGPHFVVGLLGPLLTDRRVQLVKGFYDRIMDDGSGLQAPQGGRVTELVARPLLNLYRPELSRVVQPLAGEWAITRRAFEQQYVPVGYGVEIATLLDVYDRDGLDAIAQVDLGERAHVHQSVHDLGVMAAELIMVVGRRFGVEADVTDELWQFTRGASPWTARHVPTVEREPAAELRGASC